jgi:hypothetical protein
VCGCFGRFDRVDSRVDSSGDPFRGAFTDGLADGISLADGHAGSLIDGSSELHAGRHAHGHADRRVDSSG